MISLSAGAHYMQVSKWLGHGSFVTTLTSPYDYIDTAEGKAVPLARPVASATPDRGDSVIEFRRRSIG